MQVAVVDANSHGAAACIGVVVVANTATPAPFCLAKARRHSPSRTAAFVDQEMRASRLARAAHTRRTGGARAGRSRVDLTLFKIADHAEAVSEWLNTAKLFCAK